MQRILTHMPMVAIHQQRCVQFGAFNKFLQVALMQMYCRIYMALQVGLIISDIGNLNSPRG